MTELELSPLCDAPTTLTPGEHAHLENLPDPAHEVASEVRCELQQGHAGPHTALGQESAGISWWVVWATEGTYLYARGAEATTRLYRMADCPTRVSGDDSDLCLLPRGHAGAHSFALEEGDPRVPSARARRKLAAGLRETLDDEQCAALDEMETRLALRGTPLPLLTQDEAIVVGMLLRMAADAELIVEEMAERMDARLEALA